MLYVSLLRPFCLTGGNSQARHWWWSPLLNAFTKLCAVTAAGNDYHWASKKSDFDRNVCADFWIQSKGTKNVARRLDTIFRIGEL